MTSCKKDHTPDSNIQGQVLEYGSMTPISGATVYLSRCVVTEPLGPLNCGLTDSLTTPSDGYFSFDIEGDFDGNYIADATAPQYYSSNLEVVLLSPGQEVDKNIVLDPFAWLEIHVKNIDPVDGNDKIRFTLPCNSNPYWEELFGAGDEYFLCQVRGNYDSSLIWKVTKNEITIEYRDTLSISAHDTISYEILY